MAGLTMSIVSYKCLCTVLYNIRCTCTCTCACELAKAYMYVHVYVRKRTCVSVHVHARNFFSVQCFFITHANLFLHL